MLIGFCLWFFLAWVRVYLSFFRLLVLDCLNLLIRVDNFIWELVNVLGATHNRINDLDDFFELFRWFTSKVLFKDLLDFSGLVLKLLILLFNQIIINFLWYFFVFLRLVIVTSVPVWATSSSSCSLHTPVIGFVDLLVDFSCEIFGNSFHFYVVRDEVAEAAITTAVLPKQNDFVINLEKISEVLFAPQKHNLPVCRCPLIIALGSVALLSSFELPPLWALESNFQISLHSFVILYLVCRSFHRQTCWLRILWLVLPNLKIIKFRSMFDVEIPSLMLYSVQSLFQF